MGRNDLCQRFYSLEKGGSYLPEYILSRDGSEEKAELIEIQKDGAVFFALGKVQ